ncbi:DUF421 domain-containing protein [Bacillus luteolus]|uniref:DUF421 domain-containing protein n=1 Tax=Litchfieldia luteola TaxID=682179 RepID=A0ABR9QKK8_9BACI|nr:DUF421 domain-containing protein [Cytobacillus luteolus]MBE4909041.1 DUF421 domain-containing protein [Cytobacillus luteolus]MBP1941899.1 uncharacterized membrane protein YcaP (DUF421 family) [Cytobacillus luteolus]
MGETLKEILVVYGRILTIYPLLLFAALMMGKRSIGELPVFDFLIILSLGSLVGADIADPKIVHLHTALAVVGVALLQRVFSSWSIKRRWFGRLITFEPTIVIRNGEFVMGAMKKIRYSLDNILQMLREKDVFDLSEVDVGIIEANGKLTVLKKATKLTPTLEDLNIFKSKAGVSYPVIVEGKIYTDILNQLELDEAWVLGELSKHGLNRNDIFFASVNAKNELTYSVVNNKTSSPPDILH